MRQHLQAIALIAFVADMILGGKATAVTRLPSADGQFWDIQDTSAWAQDSGGIATGGRSNPFNGFGYLKLQVRRPDNTPLTRNKYLHGFGLAFDGGERFDSITPVFCDGIVVARAIFAPKDKNYLRYFDSFTNVADEDRIVEVAWGGAAGAFDDGGRVAVAATANGDRQIDLNRQLRHSNAKREGRVQSHGSGLQDTVRRPTCWEQKQQACSRPSVTCTAIHLRISGPATIRPTLATCSRSGSNQARRPRS